MSENENNPAPSKQTSSIPLKKETVRVTLKAADAPPAAGAPAPTVAPPIASAPVVRPPTPTVAAAPVPTAPPAPTAAPTAGGAPRPAPAPTIPLKTSGAPTAPGAPRPAGPAPTIPLKTAGAPTAPGAPRPAGPAPTIPLKPSGAPTAPGATVALPKATVQLQAPTQPLGTARPSLTQAPTVQSEDEDDEGSSETVPNVLSIVGFIAACALLAFQLMIANTWVTSKYEQKLGQGEKPPAEGSADRSLFSEIFASE